jgi:hypothetical protein
MSTNGQADLTNAEARLRAIAEAQVQEQLSALRAPPAAAQPFAVPAPVAAPAQSSAELADFEQLATARFLEWTTNDGRSVFVDPAQVLAVEAHPTAAVCKVYSAGGSIVTVHAPARVVAARLQLASDARRDFEAHLDRERWRAMGAAIVDALNATPTPTENT